MGAALGSGLVGCPKPPPEPFDWATTPHVPSPRSGTYALAPGVPQDAGIADLLTGAHYDLSLAGAAAGIALDMVAGRGSLTGPELREAAWRAGWPYPVSSAQMWVGTAKEQPPAAAVGWIGLQTGTVGLVRVRSGMEDAWVGLSSTPRLDVGVVPRQLPLGGTLVLPAIPGARAALADPAGNVSEGELHSPWTTTTDQAGEWLVEVRDAQGQAALFPVYVGMVPPELDLLVPTAPPATDDEANARARIVLDEVRDSYGLGPLASDPILDAMARAWRDDPALLPSQIARLAGLDRERTWRWECEASTLESCVDGIVWDIRSRPGLFSDAAMYGLSASTSPRGVHLVMAVGEP